MGALSHSLDFWACLILSTLADMSGNEVISWVFFALAMISLFFSIKARGTIATGPTEEKE